jgi:uncharacterized protein YaiI (UPF0178 family)
MAEPKDTRRPTSRPTIWVDADACPGPIRDILVRAAMRREIQVTFVANQAVRVPRSRFLRSMSVVAGLDAADDYIAESAGHGDLVVTADIPLAARAVAAGADAVNPRGTVYTKETVQIHLARRNLMSDLRDQGAISGGPPPLGRSEIQAFANALDSHITRMHRP